MGREMHQTQLHITKELNLENFHTQKTGLHRHSENMIFLLPTKTIHLKLFFWCSSLLYFTISNNSLIHNTTFSKAFFMYFRMFTMTS